MDEKKLTKQFSGTFSRLFNAEYRQLVADLRLCKKRWEKAFVQRGRHDDRAACILSAESYGICRG